MNIFDFVDRLEKVKKNSNGWLARCPSHEDRAPSLAVHLSENKIVLHCFVGCSAEKIVNAMGLSMRDLFDDTVPTATSKPEIEATYDYVDESGKLLYQVVRMNPKGFYQRRPDASGNGWINGLNGVERVLYRLPDLIAADITKPVIIVEGEKDAERLIAQGFTATTNSGGAGKWKPEYNSYFAGRDVIVIPDNDEPGRNHARDIDVNLKTIAKSVRVAPVPNGKDVSSFLDAGGKMDKILSGAPLALDAETALLSAVVQENERIHELVANVTPEDFSKENRGMYAAMLELSEENSDINSITLAEKLKVPVSQISLPDVPAFSKLESYFKILKKRTARRRLNDLAEAIKESDEDPEDLIHFIDSKLDVMREDVVKGGFRSFADVAGDVAGKLDALRRGENPAISTGIPLLDNAMKGGGQPGELHIWAALTGGGKSALMKQLAQNIAARNIPVAILTAEMSDYEVFFRMLSPEAQVPAWRISNTISTEYLDSLDSKLLAVADLPIWIDDRTTNIFELRARVKSLVRQHSIKVLFVDYLQLLEVQGNVTYKQMSSRQEEMSFVSRLLKKLAKELDIWVIALAQFNRKANEKDEATGMSKPELHHLAESGKLEQNSDLVGIIDMAEYVVGQPIRDCALRIAKYRNGPKFPLKFRFNGDYLLFTPKNEVVVGKRKDTETKELDY